MYCISGYDFGEIYEHIGWVKYTSIPSVINHYDETEIFGEDFLGSLGDEIVQLNDYYINIITNLINDDLSDEEEDDFVGRENISKENHKKVYKQLNTVINEDLQYIYTSYIDSAYIGQLGYYQFKFKCKIPITYGLLLYSYTIALQCIDLQNENDNPDRNLEECWFYNGAILKISPSEILCKFDIEL